MFLLALTDGMWPIRNSYKGIAMLRFVLALLLLFLVKGAALAAPTVDIIRQQLPGSIPHYYV